MRTYSSKVSLWLVLFVIFIDWIGIGLVYPMFSSMLFSHEPIILPADTPIATRGLYLGILLSAMPIAQFFSGPVMGTLSDSKGRKPLYLVSLSLALVGYSISICSIFLHSALLLIFSRLIVGIAAGNTAVVSATIADLSLEHNKAKNYGLLGASCGIGFTLGPFLGGKFSETSFITPFLLAFTLTLINLISIYFMLPETNHNIRKTKPNFIDGINNIKKAFKMPMLRTLFLTVFLYGFGWSFFYEFIPVVWLTYYGLNSSSVGLLYAYGAFFFALTTSLFIHPITSRYNNNRILFYSLLFLGTTILALISKPTIAWVWVYLPIVNMFSAFFEPTATAMVSNLATKENQGEVLGIFQSVQSIAWACSPMLAGPLLGIHLQMPVILGGVAILMAAFVVGTSLRKTLSR